MIKFHHIRNKFIEYKNQFNGVASIESKGGTTIAYEVVNTDNNTKIINYAVARCNPQDNFNRKIGRAISEGRLTKKGPDGTIEVEDKDYKNIPTLLQREVEMKQRTKELLAQAGYTGW